jgi:catechol 2,3-dioxygenase-like lactoylglutathione lyase family enzyme
MTRVIESMLERYEQGRIGRRELVAALAGLAGAGRSGAAEPSTFRAHGLNHIALRVADIPRSRDFYRKHFGMPVLTESQGSCFLGIGKEHFLTLFRGARGELDHYCIAIENFRPDAVIQELQRQGLKADRPSGTDRIYLPDPDGIRVQVSAAGHKP